MSSQAEKVVVRSLRELDALVAEKVMGFEAWAETRGEYRLAVRAGPDAPRPWERKRTPDPERYESISCAYAQALGFFGEGFPRYSTDIAAAWRVVEKLGQNRVDVVLHYTELMRGCDCICGGDAVGRSEDTMPLAICLAALATQGIEADLVDAQPQPEDDG